MSGMLCSLQSQKLQRGQAYLAHVYSGMVVHAFQQHACFINLLIPAGRLLVEAQNPFGAVHAVF